MDPDASQQDIAKTETNATSQSAWNSPEQAVIGEEELKKSLPLSPQEDAGDTGANMSTTEVL